MVELDVVGGGPDVVVDLILVTPGEPGGLAAAAGRNKGVGGCGALVVELDDVLAGETASLTVRKPDVLETAWITGLVA